MEKKNNRQLTDSVTQISSIQHCLRIIAKEIKRVCDKNHIHYFMLAGTLLGSVRHKDFIPWDDDMDFGMLRQDYNDFIKACEVDLDKEHFYLQCIETDPGFGKFYIRILLNGTYLDYDYIENVNCHKGIFVDIFPYDSIPDSKILQKKQSMVTSFALRLLKKKLHYGIVCHTLGGKIELLFEPFFTKEQLIILYNKEMQRYNYLTDSKYVNSADGGSGYPKERLKRKWVTETQDMVFGDILFPGSIQYNEYLTYFFGDYMTIPPESERITHEFVNIDFGPYKS